MSSIAHFDADAFFASVEQAADRRLRRRPVAVGGGSRGVVCSASYEARAFGIHSAMPTRRALQLCPELTLIRGQFELYERFSGQLFDLCEDFTPHVEQTSIDEGYVDFRGRAGGPEVAIGILRAFDREVSEWLKITVSCGFSSQKRIAQIAGKANKPHGFTIVPEGSEAAFLEPLGLYHLPGLGPVTTRRLGQIGLRSIGDLVRVGPDILYPILGKQAEPLLELARGQDSQPVTTEAPQPKSYGEQETFDRETGDEDQVERDIKGLLENQLRRLRAARQTARTLGIGLRYSDREYAQASHSFPEPSNLDPVFLPRVRVLMKRAWQRRVQVNQIRVQLSNLYPAWIQNDLFDETQLRARRICEVGDDLNSRFGKGSLMRASQL
ncbi:DNA polymerase IV [Puniceicoccales bacterium CK1056]|uniref:DNA polymerase IV n=1 Tax=Oceanipulchritudo coccoides TaxID=2706888 RepID=A0A6B2M240_9BACT|nr:DNA polymerase IV [Oceanipulchritudo coccoides]NDV61865.1 DNA polymerase IV [Oceanipulchritudo coccoides]